jgi:competence protein ComEC
VAFAGGGVLLSAAAWRDASHAPLRGAFEALAREARSEASADGRTLPLDDEAFAVLEGTLRSDASIGNDSASLSLDVDAIDAPASDRRRTSGGIIVSVAGSLARSRADAWRQGRRVRVAATLRRPARYLDPGVPDAERALARRGTALVGSAKSAGVVEVLGAGSALDETLAAARAFARRAIASAVGRWSAQSAGIVAAIVIGDRGALDSVVQRRLQDAGTYHVIAISGGNIAILAGLLLGAFRVAGLLGRGAMLAAIALLTTYGALVGGGASVDRATLMAVVYFGARALDLRSEPLNAVAVVAALLAAVQPLVVADPAFLLTFGATVAILVAVPCVRVRGRFLEPAVSMFAASAATEALLFPVGASVFARVTFAGLALNFLASPLMAVAQVAGMAVVPLAAVSTTLARAVGWVAHAGAAGLVWSAGLVRFAPASAYRVAPPNVLVCLTYYFAIVVAWRASRWPRLIGAAIAAAAAVWILAEPWALASARGDGRLHVTFIDVGQGDAALVRFPRGHTLLVDAGGAAGAFDVGDRVVAPVIRELGVRRLDYLALSHGDPDHIGGAASIVDEFHPREVWEGIPVPGFPPLAALRVAAEAAGSRWSNVYAGSHLVVDDVDVRALHPRPAEWERRRVRNDDSLVLDVRWRDVSVLLTGDIGQASERELAVAPARLRVVKVPHHGSLTSSGEAFVARIRPTVVVASAGRANHFGHPVPVVLERYRAAGATVYRTDRDGAVEVVSDGFGLMVRTFGAGRWGPFVSARLVGPLHHEATKVTKDTK